MQVAAGHDGGASDRALLAAAQAGDEAAYAALIDPLRREIHVHCYRMLGSLDDADDALQETLLRAWRQLGRFEPRAPFRAWVYRIATNVCLSLLDRSARRHEVPAAALAGAPGDDRAPGDDPMRLDPYPDRLLDELSPPARDPAAEAERRESVALAFVAAVQLLPPRQRAVLLLREVVGYSASEVAAMLDTSVAAVNSALQRARTAVDEERRRGQIARPHQAPASAAERDLVRRLADAWHAADVAGIVELLTADAVLAMPPQPERFVGPAAIGAFLATVPGGGRLDRFRLAPTRANGQPAVGLYLRDRDDGPFVPHAMLVLSLRGGAIASLTRFADPRLFARFGLPAAVAAEPVPDAGVRGGRPGPMPPG